MPSRFFGGNTSISVEELPPVPIALLRLRRPAPSVLDRVATVLGHALPQQPGMTSGDDPRLYWFAPDEWMIVGGKDRYAALEAAVADVTAHVAYVGGGRCRFRVVGAAARDLLAKGTGLDLHARAFGAGRCARTLFAQTGILIERHRDADAFDLIADVSYAGHLRRWFADALLEFREPAA